MTQGEHILVCLSSSPANGTIIRAAARMAEAFKGEFTALYVETSQSQKMDEEDRSRLRGISVWQRSWEPRSKPPAGTTLRFRYLSLPDFPA